MSRRDDPAQARQRARELARLLVLAGGSPLLPAVVIAVLLAPGGVDAGRLDVTERVGADPDLLPGRRDRPARGSAPASPRRSILRPSASSKEKPRPRRHRRMPCPAQSERRRRPRRGRPSAFAVIGALYPARRQCETERLEDWIEIPVCRQFAGVDAVHANRTVTHNYWDRPRHPGELRARDRLHRDRARAPALAADQRWASFPGLTAFNCQTIQAGRARPAASLVVSPGRRRKRA